MTERPGMVWQWVRRIYAICVIAALIWVVSDSIGGLLVAEKWLTSPGTYIFAAAWAGLVLLLGKAWAVSIFAWSGVKLSARDWVPAQALAWAGRYLPGKVGLLLGKWMLSRRLGLGAEVVTVTVFFEQVAFICTGLLIGFLSPAAPALMNKVPSLAYSKPLIFLLGASLLILLASVSFIGFRRFWPQLRILICSVINLHSLPVLFLVVVGHLIAHALVGLGLYFLVLELAPANADIGIWQVIGALAAAHSVGALAIFAPSGLGVREVVLTASLASVLSYDAAVVLAVLARVVSVVVDLMLYFMGQVMLALQRTPTKNGM